MTDGVLYRSPAGNDLGVVGTRGRLRVYLGAAPGVGKTYAMLQEGRRQAERGVDVVVGLVETHRRTAVADLLAPTCGLELVDVGPS